MVFSETDERTISNIFNVALSSTVELVAKLKLITGGLSSSVIVPTPIPSFIVAFNGLDKFIVEKCYNMASQARKLHIPITTFMIAQDPYLQSFVEEFTASNRGKAFYTGLEGLGEMIFHDYENNRKKRIR